MDKTIDRFDPIVVAESDFRDMSPLFYLGQGMCDLASEVWELEAGSTFPSSGDRSEARRLWHRMANCFFWFANSAVNYARFVAHVDAMIKHSWTIPEVAADPAKQKAVGNHCREYTERVMPKILYFRHKMAAHFAATDMRKDDNHGTIINSWKPPVSVWANRYVVGGIAWVANGEKGETKIWSLTEEYRHMCDRFPYLVRLPPLEKPWSKPPSDP